VRAANAQPSRRRFVTGALGAAGALVAVGSTGVAAGRATEDSIASRVGSRVDFYGRHQAGIATPAQDRLAFAAFDLTTSDRKQVEVLLARWAAAAARMTQGEVIGEVVGRPQAPPIDTGEALGLGPAQLTVTVGFGSSMFVARYRLASKRPAALAEIPLFPGDTLRPGISNGDIGVQACANDPQVAFHAIRNFARLARGTAVMRWSQLGFGRTSSTSTAQDTPRNLMGFKDGTNNIKGEKHPDLDEFVWVGAETDQPWMQGGSYLVTRRIRMLIESWDTDRLADQEDVFGRLKNSGAPIGGETEFEPVDLEAMRRDGTPVIGPGAHIRLASPHSHGGQKILRRGYSFTDGIDPDTGLLDAGLFFIAYQKDPRKQFVPIQQLLAEQDRLNEYIRHTSSGLFAVPPGLSGPGHWWGKQLFG
jgi:deferrochelatase/peroxidase EfeB